MLRKSAVAVKPKKTLPKKRKPATLKKMLASAKKGAIESPKSKRPKAKQPAPIATNQSESSDSDDYQPLKLYQHDYHSIFLKGRKQLRRDKDQVAEQIRRNTERERG